MKKCFPLLVVALWSCVQGFGFGFETPDVKAQLEANAPKVQAYLEKLKASDEATYQNLMRVETLDALRVLCNQKADELDFGSMLGSSVLGAVFFGWNGFLGASTLLINNGVFVGSVAMVPVAITTALVVIPVEVAVAGSEITLIADGSYRIHGARQCLETEERIEKISRPLLAALTVDEQIHLADAIDGLLAVQGRTVGDLPKHLPSFGYYQTFQRARAHH